MLSESGIPLAFTMFCLTERSILSRDESDIAHSKGVIVRMGKKRILVVDDDRTILESLQQILETKGFNVALERMWSRHWHLALIDLRLPDMTGEKLRDKIRIVTHAFKPSVKPYGGGVPLVYTKV